MAQATATLVTSLANGKTRDIGSELQRGWYLNVWCKMGNLPKGSSGGEATGVGHVIVASFSSSSVTVKPPLWCSSSYIFCFNGSDVVPCCMTSGWRPPG
jgi:hypothetical protein